MSDSSLSIDSLILAADDLVTATTLTPEISRRQNPVNKAIGTLGYVDLLIFIERYFILYYLFSVLPRSSGSKPSGVGRWGSLKDRKANSSASFNHSNRNSKVPDVESKSNHFHNL